MTAIALAHPEWFGALVWITALSGVALIAAGQHARRRTRRLLGRGAAPQPGFQRSDAMLATALVAVAMALLGPRIGERTLQVSASGVDVVFLLDVSRSMDAADIPPSRLQRARRIISDLIARLSPGDRAALAAFADHGQLITPLTPDTNALLDVLADLESGVILPAGSRLDRGIRSALEAFEAGSERPRVLVIASDGEDPRGQHEPAYEEIRRSQTRIVTIAVGSDAGSSVLYEGRPLRLPSGTPVATRRDSARLAALAAGGGGVAYVSDEWGRIDGAAAAAEIRREIGSDGETLERRIPAIRVAPFAAVAFGLLLLEGLPRIRRPRLRRLAFVGLVLGIAPLGVAAFTGGAARSADPASAPDGAALLAAEARVARAPEDARAQLELGLAYLDHGRGEAAARAFLAASVFAADAELAAVAYYDVGVAQLGLGRLEAAREAFFEALSLDPSDTAARFNLEWTLAAMNRAAPPPAKSSGGRAEELAGDDPSQPAERETPPTSAAIDPDATTRATEATPREPAESDGMSPEERRRLLGKIPDDTRRWLGVLAGEAPDAGRRPAQEPAW